MLPRRTFLSSFAAPAIFGQTTSRIRQIDLIHHTHTDVGYTDLPSVVRDKQKRYLDAAIDLCAAHPAFRWTVEAGVVLDDWWQSASAPRRQQFLERVRGGQMDVMALPLNQTPLLDERQWQQMFDWIPASLWRAVNPKAAMQNDVNGFPRAGALRLLDRSVGHLLMGINAENGGPPFSRPAAFWWKMPDGRRIFIWLGEHYGSAMAYLGARGDSTMPNDEAALRAAHARLTARLGAIEAAGYPHDRLILTFTHPANYDNGAPFPPLLPFLEAWNRLGLQPTLRLTTATRAALEMEKIVGASIPTLEGEWTDWWANGSASGPRELAASREAKRTLAAALSPVWGPMPESAQPVVRTVLKDLCLFDEHTWGASTSVSAPYSLNSIAQYNEKSELAYRPMGQTAWLLARRARTKLASAGEGIFIANPSPAPFTGWATVPAGSLPEGSRSLVDAASGQRLALHGRRVWIDRMTAHSLRRYRPDAQAASEPSASAGPTLRFDAAGWPLSASWPGMEKPLFVGSAARFLAVQLVAPANRRTLSSLHAKPDAALRERSLRVSGEAAGDAQRTESAHSIVFSQPFQHARLDAAVRTLELWKDVPRARVTVRFDRRASTAPEVFYLAFDLPQGLPLPVFSCGGLPFTPYRGQLPGACRDYFGIDAWAHYADGPGHWLWVTRDAPLVALGGPHVAERHQQEPAAPHHILAMVFDNTWHTNFVADSNGTMQFQFELAWSPRMEKPAEIAESLTAEPFVFSPAAPEAKELLDRLWRP